ncbi:hypothetical protein ORIO_12555 [Cereibacter azotoformans]|uniref:hypothetical protein n=1 Tax=Cereibacter azotoformans TaxID=43057 RepID=UPI001EE9DE3A|nr:hypothetical protein [Cereibacter azotoformans]ULB10734.1 hypothetical protein ORIO_12555 [Cereibacter azotoformans]
MSRRAQFRQIARDALAADPRMSLLTQIGAWEARPDASQLPLLMVVTPVERPTQNTISSFERATILQVGVKRLGGADLEDALDADADAIERAVFLAMHAQGVICLPDDVTVTVNTDGEQSIGTLISSFRIVWRRPVPRPT